MARREAAIDVCSGERESVEMKYFRSQRSYHKTLTPEYRLNF